MRLIEMVNHPAVDGYQDVNSDHSKPIWKQSRKSKLTLKQIRKLRKMSDVRAYENKEHMKRVHAQYGPKAEPAGGPTL